jgi:hypothetical protein
VVLPVRALFLRLTAESRYLGADPVAQSPQRTVVLVGRRFALDREAQPRVGYRRKLHTESPAEAQFGPYLFLAYESVRSH